ncbi:MAG: response regulator transcription factor [Hyphomicrobiaceae bacterium]
MPGYRVIIVDDHPLFRDALRQALSAAFEGIDIAEAASIDEVAETLSSNGDADLVLLDLNMPGVRGFSGLIYLRAQHPEVPIVVVSASEDAITIRRSIDLGASGFVPKSLPVAEIRAAVAELLKGEIFLPPDYDPAQAESSGETALIARLQTLTPQQVRVLMMLGQGLLNKQIAYELGVSEATVKAHVSAILQKLGVDSRTQAVIAVNRIETGDWQKLASE